MYEDSQKTYAPTAVGQIGNPNSVSRQTVQGVPKDAPSSLVQTERFFAGLSEFHTLINRLGNVADRISGPTPDEASQGDRPPPSNLSDRLDFAAVVFASQITQLRQEIERLERFV